MSRVHQLACNEEGFVFDPTTGDSFVTNSTGLFLLKTIRDGKDEELHEALIENFQVEEEEAERDIVDFKKNLQNLGII